jgi:hypothetical protein
MDTRQIYCNQKETKKKSRKITEACGDVFEKALDMG